MDEEPKNTSELIIFLDDQSEERHDIRKVWYNNRFYKWFCCRTIGPNEGTEITLFDLLSCVTMDVEKPLTRTRVLKYLLACMWL